MSPRSKTLESLWLDGARGQYSSISSRLLILFLVPLEWLYRIGLAVYLFLERIGIRRRKGLSARVVSVGNLTLGGTGKTSVVESLARSLYSQTCVAVLLRGYGGGKSRSGVVVSTGDKPVVDWSECGDEAYLLAQNLPGVAVLTGKDRRISGSHAVEELGASLLLLDDGLQYWQLYRDLDIVLVDARLPFGNGHVMPAGILREPLGGIRRAGAVIVTHANEVTRQQLGEVLKLLRKVTPDSDVFSAHYAPVGIYPMLQDGSHGEMQEASDTLRGQKVLVFCGIGTPESFSLTLEDAGAVVVAEFFLPDHHVFTQQDVDKAENWAQETGARFIMTTEKDSVRLVSLDLPENFRVLRADLLIQDYPRLLELVSGLGD